MEKSQRDCPVHVRVDRTLVKFGRKGTELSVVLNTMILM